MQNIMAALAVAAVFFSGTLAFINSNTTDLSSSAVNTEAVNDVVPGTVTANTVSGVSDAVSGAATGVVSSVGEQTNVNPNPTKCLSTGASGATPVQKCLPADASGVVPVHSNSVNVNNPAYPTINAVNSNTTNTASQELAPLAIMMLNPRVMPLTGKVQIGIKVPKALAVEIYLRSVNALTHRYVGNALRLSEFEWNFIWDTADTPNGYYEIWGRVRNNFGEYESEKMRVSIKNILITPTEQTIINKMQDSVAAAEQKTQEILRVPAQEATQNVSNEFRKFLNVVRPEMQPEQILPIDKSVANLNLELQSDLERLQKERELKRETLHKAILEKLETTGNQIITRTPERIRAEAEHKKREVIINAEKSITEFSKKIDIEQKRGPLSEYIFKDSDRDSVSDYDEIKLYHTNPVAGDSDNDGFNDSLEIRVGSNPLDPTVSDKIIYEEPKAKGEVDRERFKIEHIAVVETAKTPEGKETAAKIEIKGKAIPNSFVTIYIYSANPIIVTVKANAEGEWTYTLDKELADGAHEVYVATTDTTGKIAAKSEPLPFVKTASAIVIGADLNDAVAKLRAAENSPSFFRPTNILFGFSLIILAIGFALIIIGYSAKKNPTNPTNTV